MLGAGGNSPELEFALLAAGVPEDKPVSARHREARLRRYDKIKPNVVKWWETGAIPTQMLTRPRSGAGDGVERADGGAGNRPEVPAAISWKEGLLKRDCWAVPKGSKNKRQCDEVHRLSAPCAIPQARLSSLIPYGYVNNKPADAIHRAAKQLEVLPSGPSHQAAILVPYDYELVDAES